MTVTRYINGESIRVKFFAIWLRNPKKDNYTAKPIKKQLKYRESAPGRSQYNIFMKHGSVHFM